MEVEMQIPLGTIVQVKPGILARLLKRPLRSGEIVYRDEDEDGKPPLYTVEFEDETSGVYPENKIIAPSHCKCGNRMDEVCFIPGTDCCFACHELYVMGETGFGVALHSPLGAYVR
jgi:hypothetical protein